MKKFYLFGSVLLLLISPRSYGQEAHEASATIAYISKGGKVFCKKANSQAWLHARMHFSLDIGDSIKAGDSTSVIIVSSMGKRIELKSRQAHIIQSNTQSKSPYLKYLVSLITGENIGSYKRAVRSDKNGPPLLLFPQKGKVLDPRPDFVWFASTANTVYQIRLEKTAGGVCKTPEKTILKENTTDTLFVFPAKIESLIPGMMYWAELKDKNSNKTAFSDCFFVVEEAERDRVQKEVELIKKQYHSDNAHDLTWIYATASYLMVHEFYTEALRLLRNAALEHSDDVTLEAFLNHVSAKLKL